MGFLTQLMQDVNSVPHALLTLSLCAAFGAAIGNISFRGVQLGSAGVLFAGLAFGHFGVTLNHQVLDFARELGLALFVYMVGLRVGPGFFSSLGKHGLRLNSLAAAIVGTGAIITLAVARMGKIDIAAAAGIFCGATTNTPALGAATQLLSDTLGSTAERVRLPELGYAVAYPFGVIGIISSLLLIRWIAGANIQSEAERFEKEGAVPALKALSLNVINPNLEGVKVSVVSNLMGGKVSITRVRHNEEVTVATPEMILHTGDVIHAVGTEEHLREFKILIGAEAGVNLAEIPSDVVMNTLVVTNKHVVDKTLAELNLSTVHGVSVTRLTRGEVELLASPNLRLQYGDMVRVVGAKTRMGDIAKLMGNSKKSLQTPDLLSVFLGLSIGIFIGTIPIAIPGISVPVKLGMAAGPLIVALYVGRLGQIGGIISYLPNSTNDGLKEFGILMFIACVGLKAGGNFIATLLYGDGLFWMACGIIITVLPLILVGLFARYYFKMNMLTVWGVCCGSTTDPPALAFATRAASSNAAAIGYATVYPAAMLMRVVVAQLIILVGS